MCFYCYKAKNKVNYNIFVKKYMLYIFTNHIE